MIDVNGRAAGKSLRSASPPRHVVSLNMPWETIGQMTDDELKAIWLFLQSAQQKKSEIDERAKKARKAL
jgi:hypothetical protein